MNHTRNIRRIVLRMALIGSLSMSVGGCVETVPEELVEAVESIDRDLFTLRAADLTPEAYSKFSRQWIALRGRIESEENIVRWPWEDNELETELEALQAEGTHLVAEVNSRIQAQRTAAEAKLAKVEQRLRLLNTKVGDIGSRVVLGEHPLETELLVKQARHYLEQGQFDYANQASERASQNLFKQTALLTNELGRYADDDLIAAHDIGAIGYFAPRPILDLAGLISPDVTGRAKIARMRSSSAKPTACSRSTRADGRS